MKSKYFFRYRFIIELLQRNTNTSYEDIEAYLYNKFDVKGYDFSYSLRTFQRDKKDIEELFGIEIKFDRSALSYYIDEADISETSKKLLDAYTLTSALQLYDDFSKYISFEKENFGNPGVFYQLNEAVNNRQQI